MFRKSLIIVACAALAAPALAGLGGLGTTVPGFDGTWQFETTYLNGTVLKVDVDYAVFQPSALVGTVTPSPFAPYATPDLGEYIYAYQINVLAESTVPLSRLGIDLDANRVTGVGYDGALPQQNANRAQLRPDSLTFRFDYTENNELNPGTQSFLLLYSSPDAPTYTTASIVDGGTSISEPNSLPAPIPTPGAAMLGVLGLGTLLWRRN
jgi:hypothetical protein